MSKDARNDDRELSSVERDQFDRLVALLAQRGFGEDGPPVETTFAQIEQFGHRAGQMVARAVERLPPLGAALLERQDRAGDRRVEDASG